MEEKIWSLDILLQGKCPRALKSRESHMQNVIWFDTSCKSWCASPGFSAYHCAHFKGSMGKQQVPDELYYLLSATWCDDLFWPHHSHQTCGEGIYLVLSIQCDTRDQCDLIYSLSSVNNVHHEGYTIPLTSYLKW